jgi:hypothetical protein
LCSAADVLLMMMMDVVVVGVVFDLNKMDQNSLQEGHFVFEEELFDWLISENIAYWLWWIFFQELMLGN